MKKGSKRLVGVLIAGTLVLMIWLAFRLSASNHKIPDRLLDAANLASIATACMVYAQNHDGAFPPELATLIKSGAVMDYSLQHPLDSEADDLCDYYYVTGLSVKDPGDWVLAYSDKDYYNGEGACILFRDTRKQFVPSEEFAQILEQFKVAYMKDRGAPPVIIPPS